MIHESDKFKALAQINQPDSRVKFWSHGSDNKLSDFHTDINRIVLADYVNVEVVKEFEKSKNILLYSYFSYSMSSVSLLHAYACVEKTIHLKAKELNIISDNPKEKNTRLLKSNSGLSKKINFALERKWLGKKHFFYYDLDEELISLEAFNYHLKSWIDFRNSLAHNPSFLGILWQLTGKLQTFANMINAISYGGLVQNEGIPLIELPKWPSQNFTPMELILRGQKSALFFTPFIRS